MTRRTISMARRVRPEADDHAHGLLHSLNLPTFLRTIVGRMSIMSDRIIVGVTAGGSAAAVSNQRFVSVTLSFHTLQALGMRLGREWPSITPDDTGIISADVSLLG